MSASKSYSRVRVLPGSMFGPQQEGFVRCAFANVEAALMPEVARRLAASSGRAG